MLLNPLLKKNLNICTLTCLTYIYNIICKLLLCMKIYNINPLFLEYIKRNRSVLKITVIYMINCNHLYHNNTGRIMKYNNIK